MELDESLARQVLSIAEDIFTAMIDREPGGLTSWESADLELSSPLHAWVNAAGEVPVRVALTAERSTCVGLARALMQLDGEEPVSTEDLIDALGEVANVVGGNVKALVRDPGPLSLPEVSDGLPFQVTPAVTIPLSWQGRFIRVSVWKLVNEEGN